MKVKIQVLSARKMYQINPNKLCILQFCRQFLDKKSAQTTNLCFIITIGIRNEDTRPKFCGSSSYQIIMNHKLTSPSKFFIKVVN